MALPASGPLSIQQINAEFGRGNDLNSYRGTTWYTAAGGSGTFSTGAISIGDFYGKQLASPSFSFTIYSHIDQANLRSLAVNAGWNQSSPVTATLAAGYYIYSTNTGVAALTIDGSFPGGVTFVNNGYVMGMGGHGGGYYYNNPTNITNWEVSSGGNAINLGTSCTIQNNSYIGGGGGGGSYGGSSVTGGGGAGGGVSGSFYYTAGGTNPVYSRAGAAGGGLGSNGSNGSGVAAATISGVTDAVTGGGGGRIMPGSNTGSSSASNGTVTAYGGFGGGNGNSGGNASVPEVSGAGSFSTVGIGGSAGGSGAAAVYVAYYYSAGAAGGGGGWGASGGSGGADSTITAVMTNPSVTTGGKAVHLNGYSVTWAATGTRYGAIS